MKIKYKILNKKSILKYTKWILEFYDKDRKRPKDIIKSIKNSSFIVIALDGNKVVWMNQILTELYYCAFYINLFVDEEYRNQWIWWKIIDISNKFVIKKNLKWCELITNPWKMWLPEFYSKHGFESNEKNWVYMSLNKDTII